MGEYNLYGESIYYRPSMPGREMSIIEHLKEENRYLEMKADSYRRERDRLMKKPEVELPKQYIINDNATILFWDKQKKDKTIVKRADDDEFNARLGFLTAFFQHYSGMSRSKANKFLANLKVERK